MFPNRNIVFIILCDSSESEHFLKSIRLSRIHVFEVDKKFQRISIAFVKFYVINDLKKSSRSIWSLFESIAIYRVTIIKNLHNHSAPAFIPRWFLSLNTKSFYWRNRLYCILNGISHSKNICVQTSSCLSSIHEIPKNHKEITLSDQMLSNGTNQPSLPVLIDKCDW